MMATRSWFAPLLVASCIIVAVGCSKQKLTELADKAKQTVSEQADKVTDAVSKKAGEVSDSAKEGLGIAGKFELTVDAPIATSACYVQFLSQGSGRPAVLRLCSYRESEQESFPSVLFQAQVKAGGLSELVGQSVSGRLFIQPAQNGPVWSSPSDKLVVVKVISVEDKVFDAEIESGAVRQSDANSEKAVTGRITGVLP